MLSGISEVKLTLFRGSNINGEVKRHPEQKNLRFCPGYYPWMLGVTLIKSFELWTVWRSVREDDSNEYICSPYLVTDHFTATEVIDSKTKLIESIISFHQFCIAPRSHELDVIWTSIIQLLNCDLSSIKLIFNLFFRPATILKTVLCKIIKIYVPNFQNKFLMSLLINLQNLLKLHGLQIR